MDNNGFDNFDSFGNDDGFVGDSFDDFGDFGSDSFNSEDSFDSSFGIDDTSNQPDLSMTNNGSAFADDSQTYSNSDFSEDSVEEAGALSKKSLIIIGAGVLALILVIIIASAVTKSIKNKNELKAQQEVIQTQQVVEQRPASNVDNILGEGNTQQVIEQQPVVQTQTTVVNNIKSDDTVWTEITANEAVEFRQDATDMTFTITGIHHKARAVDNNSNLVVKTTLSGSISGLSGTYEIDVPYNKGIKLVVGDSFTVHVQLGTYNGKTVVGEILY